MLAGQMGIYCGGPWLISGLKEAEINFGVTGMPAGDKEAAGVIEVGALESPPRPVKKKRRRLTTLSPTGIQTRLVKNGPAQRLSAIFKVSGRGCRH